MKRVHQLNPGELELIEMAKAGDPNPFTDYYLRGPNTGTWWFPGAKRAIWKRGYAQLHKYWKRKDQPATFDFEDKTYTTVAEHEFSEAYPNYPAFHHNHGIKLLPYGLEFYKDRTPVRVLVGGKGSGKTLNVGVIPMLVYAAIYEGFRGFALAPEATQANEVLRLAWEVLQGTLYLKRFISSNTYTRGPNAAMRISNSLVGETSIECYPLLKHEDKLLTLTGDMAFVDQAEKFDNPTKIMQDVGTRFRGRVVESGRSRIGTLTFSANSDYNDDLFRLYDMAEEDSKHFLAKTVSTYDNPYLTERDLDSFEIFAGTDEEMIDVQLRGKRPLGNGKEFSANVLNRMKDPRLDAKMTAGLATHMPGYTRFELKGAGLVEWLLPYDPTHRYLVVSDPGTDNPPNRNAFAILVWDITHFPGTKDAPVPASLVGFIWGSGKGEIKNWANRHAELTWYYHAINCNAFDATGYQDGYDEWILILNNLMSEKISLSTQSKAHCLNSAKMLTSNGLIKMPVELGSLYNQLQRYELPEPPKLKQDLVMAFIMSCDWLQRLWYMINPMKIDHQDVRNYLEDRNEREIETRDYVYSE